MNNLKRGLRGAALLLIVPVAAFAAEPLDIKGLRLGISEAEALQILTGAKCADILKPPPSPERFCSDRTSTLAGHPVRFHLSLRSGTVVTITASFNADHAGDIRRAAISKYGKPRDVIDTAIMWPSGDEMLIYNSNPIRDSHYLILSSRAEREIRDKARAKDF